MKKFVLIFLTLLVSGSSYAQFERDKIYINASLSGAGLSYSKSTDLNFGVNATAGLFLNDCWAAVAEADLDYADKSLQQFGLGAGFRYYMIKNGLYAGATARYQHRDGGFNDLQLKAELGYAYFITKTVTVEPAIYYKQSLKSQDYSTFGVKIGFGVYF